MKNLRRNLRELVKYFDVRFLNSGSTARTSLGFVRTLFGDTADGRALNAIFNYLPVSERIGSSGQPTREQFPAIRDAGFRRVINLAPHHAENAIADERQIVESLGMDYVHIPVDFEQPAEEDFARFCAALEDARHDRVFVHCAANMRVSAFLFRYRTRVLGEPVETARADLEKIWKPFGNWEQFIRQ